MAKIVAHPNNSLERFTGLDSSKDVEEYLSPIERKTDFLFGDRPRAKEAQNAYDARRKALSGSVLRGPWLNSFVPSRTMG